MEKFLLKQKIKLLEFQVKNLKELVSLKNGLIDTLLNVINDLESELKIIKKTIAKK